MEFWKFRGLGLRNSKLSAGFCYFLECIGLSRA